MKQSALNKSKQKSYSIKFIFSLVIIFTRKSINTFAWQWLKLTSNPIIWIFSAIFLLVTQIMVFYFGNWLDRNQADLSHLFYFLPWILIFYCSCLTMGGFAQEKRNNTIELTRIFNFSGFWHTVFMIRATILFAILTISMLASLWFFAAYLGEPDHRMIISSFVGVMMIAAVYITGGFFVSSFSKNVLSTIILTIFVLLALTFISSRIVLDYLSNPIFDLPRSGLTFLSPLLHYYKFTRGIINLASITYLLLLMLLFIVLTWLNVFVLTKKAYIYKISTVLIFFFSSYLASFIDISFDATRDKRFSLTADAKEFLSSFDQDTTITIYYSKSLGRVNPSYDNLLELFETRLKQIDKVSPAKITSRTVFVELFEKSEEEATAAGIIGVPIDNLGNEGYFGINLTALNDQQSSSSSSEAIATSEESIDNLEISDAAASFETISFVSEEISSNFDNEILKRLVSLSSNNKLKIALITALPLITNSQNSTKAYQINNKIINNLSSNYDLKPIFSATNLSLFDPDHLLIVEPGSLDTDMMFVIEQFLAKGKSATIFIDSFLEEYPSQEGLSLSATSTMSLKQLLNNIGLEVVNNEVVKDHLNAEFGSVQLQTGSYQQLAIPIWLRLKPVSNNSVIKFAESEYAFFASASQIKLNDKQTNFSYQPLFMTSANKGSISLEDLISQDFDKILSEDQTQEGDKESENYIVSILAKGNYTPTISKSELQQIDSTASPLSEQLIAFNKLKENSVSSSQKPSSISVISDTDILQDSRWFNQSSGAFRANASFVHQLVDYQNNYQSFSNQSKNIKFSSPFTKLEEIRAKSQKQYFLEEQTLLENILTTKTNIRDLDKETQEDEINKFTKELNENIERIRKIRYDMKKDITYLSTLIKIINIYLIPGLVLFLGLIWCRFRLQLLKRRYLKKIQI